LSLLPLKELMSTKFWENRCRMELTY
jgi:hypothetical protein